MQGKLNQKELVEVMLNAYAEVQHYQNKDHFGSPACRAANLLQAGLKEYGINLEAEEWTSEPTL